MSVRLSTPAEEPMQASKWLDLQALLDLDEMSLFLNELPSLYFFLTGCICKKGEESPTKEQFITAYGKYIDALKNGILPEEKQFRSLFSAVMTVTPKSLFAIPVKDDRLILRVATPSVQMQFHRLGYSKVDYKFRPMAFGPESIFWGIQFSYPQLYQNLNTNEVFTVNESPDFPNTILFRAIQRWIRHHTIPTPFLLGEQKIHVPMRLGKQCLSWINRHPQLKELNLSVAR